MAKGGGRLLAIVRRSFATLLFGLTLLASPQQSEAACYRLLKPNGWQYETVCNNSGGGGRGYSGGGGGGFNYGAAAGFAGAAAGFLQGLANTQSEQPSGGSSGAPRPPSCQSGFRLLSSGGCAPMSAVDCGRNTYCPSGHVCRPDGKCESYASIETTKRFEREWAEKERQKEDAAVQELNEIKRQIARQQSGQQSEPSSVAPGLLPRQANPFATSRSGASGEPEAKPSTARERWSGSGEKADCERAGRLERNTAAWDAMCGPDAGKKAPPVYRSPIDAQNLAIKAKAQCGSAPAEQMNTCVMNAKAGIILADDSFVRGKCLSETGAERTKCIELAYLYGPSGPSKDDLRRYLREDIRDRIARMSGTPKESTEYKATPISAPPTGCEPGFGMKPTPGAFGEWSCQKLGVLFFAPDRKTVLSSDSPEAVENVRQFEDGIDRTAAMATEVAMKALGGDLSEEDRQICIAATFAAVRGVLKGGAASVPERCFAIANAAQAELPYIADNGIPVSAGVQVLLAEYLQGVNPPPAVPASELAGLEPTEEMRRDGACMRGTGDGCNGSSTPAPAVRAADAGCAEAAAHWKAVEEIRTIPVYQDHLNRFPACAFATLAAARIEQLRTK